MPFGRPPSVIAAAMANPMRQPSSAEATEMRIEIQYADRIDGWKRLTMFRNVASPSAVRNAPRMMCIVGRIRKSSAKSVNGTRPSHASGRRGTVGGRCRLSMEGAPHSVSAPPPVRSGTVSGYCTLAPTTRPSRR